ncbi:MULTISPECIES: hypothetical protein [Streptomyces]|uniref:hypothetical protein n=1 Tax=Streptomyces TaxID=1883 RepID=UPI002FF06D42
MTGHTQAILTKASSPDGTTLASSALDGTVRLWHVQAPASGTPRKPVSGLGQPLVLEAPGQLVPRRT